MSENEYCDSQGALLPEEVEAIETSHLARIIGGIPTDVNVVDLDAPIVEIETDDPLQQKDSDG